ncbi:hypothetical protein DC31_09490 [Microbacterium sp. CH12i]|uniref:hypothetical protein n=1 Tax=Microbacterium sp. CH12i TaxID=1479651 RepID=UPI000461E940|nr:hypothetical protein [Microbacterium sp. CH12i]KDA06599.1 hypothetical protein DC31_09490 [Microbacterium sp. CH12i]
MLKKLAVISLTAGALVLVAPAVASAAPSDLASFSDDSYAKPPQATVENSTVDLCEASTIVFGSGFFLPGENVSVGISGNNAANASYSGNVANADGGLVLSFRPPANGSGTYAVAFTGSASYTATITVSRGHDATVSCDHDPAVAAAGSDGFELALTGGGFSPWVLGGGAAALVAGGVLVAAGITRRKRA